jgi:hypothetical protein
MVITMSFIQANLQHSIVASRILTGTVDGKGIDMALLPGPWYRDGCIRGLNIPGYSLFSVSGADRPLACILTRIETASMLPGFSCRDLVAARISYNEAWSYALHTYLMIPSIPLHQRNLRTLCVIVKR